MTRKPQNENAVVFVCDQSYVRFALFVIWQIAHHNPARGFDFVIYSPDEITLPDWAAPFGIKVLRATPLADVPSHALFHGTAITLYRLCLARELGEHYRRIISMDCDMYVEGGDFDQLFKAELGPHAIAGALDVMFLMRPNHQAEEYRLAGMPALPYLNAGFQMIDTSAYVDDEVEKRALSAIRQYPSAIKLADQSALNLALKGKFAQLSPAWNWARNASMPLVTYRFPVFVRHFIGKDKPERESKGAHDARFSLSYREFFGRHEPAYLANIVPPCPTAPMSMRDAADILWRHFKGADLAGKLIARHPDPYQLRL